MKSDLIRRWDAINEIQNKHKYCYEDGLSYKCYKRAIKDIMRVPSVREWTPVAMGLPNEKGDYMVTIEYLGWHGEKNVMLSSVRYTKTKGWHLSQGKVIAWMPLPEPYKEDKDE